MERFGSSLVLLDKLAAGGMAEVYRAKQLGHGGFEKIVAVKRILPQYAESEDFKEMFLQEASLSAHLQHPNVIQTYSNGEVGGYLYLTMEFVDGKNLRQVLAKVDRQKKRIPIEIALFMIAEAAKGLHYAHEYVDERTGQGMNIVHRDMSPQNVMLGYDGTVKIVDFGIAKMAAQAESTRAGVLKGKFGYMSPEQARGMPLDRRTDIFALGIILFEVLTQRRLFASDDDMRTLRLVKECRIPRPSKYNPSIGPQLDQIVLKSLAKERSERYLSSYELYEDVQRLLQEMYPKFMASDFSKFLKATFVDEIREEKQKREKLMREAPALLDESRQVASKPTRSASETDEEASQAGNATFVEDDQATQVSNAMNAVDGLEVPAVGERGTGAHTNNGESFSAPSGNSAFVNLQLESSQIVKQSPSVVRELPRASDLPPSQDFGGPQRTYVGPAPDQAFGDRPLPPRSAKNSMRTRRLAYISIILIGVVVYLADTSAPSKQDPVQSGGEVAQVDAAANPLQAVPSEQDAAPAALPTEEVAQETMTEPVVENPPVMQGAEPDVSVAVVPPPAAEPKTAPVEARQPATSFESEGEESSRGGLPGYLSITSYPRADRILINGQVMRSKNGQPLVGSVSQHPIAPGEYEITLHNATYGVSWSGRVRIRSQKISPLLDVVLK